MQVFVSSFIQILLLCSLLFNSEKAFSIHEKEINQIPQTQNKNWVDNTNRQIRELQNTNPVQAKKYAQKAFQVADSINYQEGKIEAGILLSGFLSTEAKYDSAKIILNGLLNEFNKTLHHKEFIHFWVTRGIVYYDTGDYDSAMINYETAFEIVPGEIETNNTTAPIYTNRANVFGMRGEYSKAVEDYLKVVHFYEQNNKLEPLAQIYNNIAAETRNLDEFEKSIAYYKKAVEIYKTMENNSGLAQIYANMGVSYKQIDSIKTAIKYYEMSLEIAKNINNPLFVAQNMLNLGNIYEKEGEYKKAIELFNSSLEICKKANINYGIMLNLLNLGHSNMLANNLEQAEQYYREALVMTREMKLPKEEYQVLDRLSKLNEKQGNFEDAYQNHKQFYTLKDSIQSARQQEYILELEKKYETDKKELSIVRLEKNRLLQRFIILALVLAGLVLLVLFQRIFLRNKISKRDHLIEKQKADLLQTKIETKNRELNNTAIQVIEMQIQLRKTNEKIREFIRQSPDDNHPTFKKILSWLKTNHLKRSLLKDFENQLTDSNQEFYNKLLADFPDLTPTELKICAMLILNLSSKEIANLLNRSVRTIDFTRNSIRKKLKLDVRDNLHTFLISV